MTGIHKFSNQQKKFSSIWLEISTKFCSIKNNDSNNKECLHQAPLTTTTLTPAYINISDNNFCRALFLFLFQPQLDEKQVKSVTETFITTVMIPEILNCVNLLEEHRNHFWWCITKLGQHTIREVTLKIAFMDKKKERFKSRTWPVIMTRTTKWRQKK